MNTQNLLVSSSLLVSLLASTPAQAQRVSADIRIGGGPIDGWVRIGDRDRYRSRPVVRRIYVERIRRDHGRHYGWYKNFRRGARIVVVYYDPRDDYYYDRGYDGLEEIRVYERDGRYYRIDDDGYGTYDDRGYGRYDDRYGRQDGRYDGRYDQRNSRRDGRYDGRYDDRRDRDRDRDRDWDRDHDRDRENH
jgi:hypothetical protein